MVLDLAFTKVPGMSLKKILFPIFVHFFINCKLLNQWNNTYITLILKKKSPQEFADFRPINLGNFNYKIILKILADRLKSLLPIIIPEG